MATSVPTICSKLPFHPLPNSNFKVAFFNVAPGRNNVAFFTTHDSYKRLSCVDQPRGRDHRSRLKPICGARGGQKTEEEEVNFLPIGNAKIVVESQGTDKMKLRVDLTGEQTKKAFKAVLTRLYRSAPPTRGILRNRNGRLSKIPKNRFLKILGEDCVRQYAMKQVVNSSAAKYVNQIHPDATSIQVIRLNQTDEELIESFVPGNEFGFNVEFEIFYD